MITCRRSDFRICHVSVQGNHVHLIVEADNHMALARGMQGFQIACARRFNITTRRTGRVFADRYHPRPLATLRETRNALAYVLNNWRRHREDAHARHLAFDPFASARAFDGWANDPRRAHLEFAPVVMPTTWHLTTGWRRYGPLSPHQRPGPIAPERPSRRPASRTKATSRWSPSRSARRARADRALVRATAAWPPRPAFARTQV